MDDYLSDQDIFADDSTLPPEVEETAATKTLTPQKSREICCLKKMMGRVPPPPEVTNPTIDISTMVSSWYSNKHLWWEVSVSQRTVVSDGTQSEFDVYMNFNCEETELLKLKVAERLVSSETSSSFVMHETLTSSAKKRQRRNGWAKSPGSRLSYLAKRRNTFCKRTNDLSKARTISIPREDKNKFTQTGQLNLKRALFRSPDKGANFTTPDPRCKRQRLMNISEMSERPLLQRNPDSKLRPCTRNLGTEFEKFKCEKVMNPRLKQLWNRTPFAAITTSAKMKIL